MQPVSTKIRAVGGSGQAPGINEKTQVKGWRLLDLEAEGVRERSLQSSDGKAKERRGGDPQPIESGAISRAFGQIGPGIKKRKKRALHIAGESTRLSVQG